MSKRFPNKIQQLIDGLARDHDTIVCKYGTTAKEELKKIISSLAELKCEVKLNKEFRQFKVCSPDRDLWNTSLCELSDQNTYFTSRWIFAQCYTYRRIREMFFEQSSLKCYDYFQKQKKNALVSQFGPMKLIAKYIDENRTRLMDNSKKLEQYFNTFIKLNLWSNQMDLSFTEGKQRDVFADPIASVNRFDKSILVNDIEKIWKCISDPEIDHNTTIVDFVCDNVGYELFTDFCIGDILLENCLASCIRFHVKMVPFYISDVMPADFLWTIHKLRTHTDNYLAKLGQRCSDYLQDGRFQLMKEYFWTTGYCYNQLQEIDNDLHKKLEEAHLIIFKGDVNYRKLLDIHWEPHTPFKVALQGFLPSNLCSLRTVKCELICGLEKGVQEKIEKKNPKWLLTGEYGVIQFDGKDN